MQNFFNTPYTNPYFPWQFKNSNSTISPNKFTSFQTVVWIDRSSWSPSVRFISTRSRPSRNDLGQLSTLGCDKRSSPNWAWRLVKISGGTTPSFVRNVIIIRCATLLGASCSAILMASDGWGGQGPNQRRWQLQTWRNLSAHARSCKLISFKFETSMYASCLWMEQATQIERSTLPLW
jgi:hypothetical protein